MAEIAYIRATGIFDDSRATKELLTLGKAGHTIHVLSWDRYGNAEEKNAEIFRDYPNINFSYFKRIIPRGIGLRNLHKLILWFIWVDKALRNHNHIDVIHACNLDTAIPALKFCKRCSCKLVYDIFDYYVDSHNIPFVLTNTVENKEIEVINFADTTIICTEERKEQIVKATPKRIVVIYNSPDITKTYDCENFYDYVYCGALSSKRLIGEILEDYPAHSDLKFYFAGYGEFSEKCKYLSEKYPNFSYDEPIPYEAVLEKESHAKCISAIYDPSVRNHRLCAPNKFYEALALGKPVIVCKGTGIDRTVSQTDCGEIIDYSSDDFYKALMRICTNKNYNPHKQIDLFKSKYQWHIMGKRLLSIYHNI